MVTPQVGQIGGRSSSTPRVWSGGGSGGRLRQCFFVLHPAESRRHPGALVEAKSSQVALCVDTQPDATLAPVPEPAERIRDERRADPAPAPRATRKQDLDEAATIRVGSADRSRGDLVFCSDDTPQTRFEAFARQVGLRPGFKIARGVLPVIRKRLLLGRVEGERVTLRFECGDGQPLGPSRYRRRSASSMRISRKTRTGR